jgi:hypothetical protein
MLSIEQAKKLIGNSRMNDDDVAQLVDSARIFVEVLFDGWEPEENTK